jgi:arylsulfatase A-like enzyme
MQRPNILFFCTDQQRGDTIGAHGNPHIRTPHLDALAASGAAFTQHFVQHPLCMPSRASMLTGRYPSSLGITWMGVPVPEDVPLLPHYLRPYGYRTASIGKLHLLPHANRDHRLPHPAYGFDQLEVSDEPGVYNDAYRAWVEHKRPDQAARIDAGLPPATQIWRAQMGSDDGVQRADAAGRDDFAGVIPFPADEDLTHTAFVAEQTIAFLRQQRANQPFLCFSSFFAPHAPLIVPQRFLDLYDRDALPLPDYPPEIEAQRRASADPRFSDAHLREIKHGYYALISEIDYHVGRVLAELDALGLADHTIVVFTSDHGEWLGDHLRYSKGYPGDDAVARVPLLIRAPGAPAARRIERIVESVDIVPTLLELAAIQRPPALQGRSLAPLLAGQAADVPDCALMEGDGWKHLRTPDYRYLVHANGREGLWDIRRDPGEYTDVAATPEYAPMLHAARHLLLQRLLTIEPRRARTWAY